MSDIAGSVKDRWINDDGVNQPGLVEDDCCSHILRFRDSSAKTYFFKMSNLVVQTGLLSRDRMFCDSGDQLGGNFYLLSLGQSLQLYVKNEY